MPKKFCDLVYTSGVCYQISGKDNLSVKKNNKEEQANPYNSTIVCAQQRLLFGQ